MADHNSVGFARPVAGRTRCVQLPHFPVIFCLKSMAQITLLELAKQRRSQRVGGGTIFVWRALPLWRSGTRADHQG